MSNDRADASQRPRPLSGGPSHKLYNAAMKRRYGKDWRAQAVLILILGVLTLELVL